jgi:hypothetical protein
MLQAALLAPLEQRRRLDRPPMKRHGRPFSRVAALAISS